jgi:hypothetical protein
MVTQKLATNLETATKHHLKLVGTLELMRSLLQESTGSGSNAEHEFALVAVAHTHQGNCYTACKVELQNSFAGLAAALLRAVGT